MGLLRKVVTLFVLVCMSGGAWAQLCQPNQAERWAWTGEGSVFYDSKGQAIGAVHNKAVNGPLGTACQNATALCTFIWQEDTQDDTQISATHRHKCVANCSSGPTGHSVANRLMQINLSCGSCDINTTAHTGVLTGSGALQPPTNPCINNCSVSIPTDSSTESIVGVQIGSAQVWRVGLSGTEFKRTGMGCNGTTATKGSQTVCDAPGGNCSTAGFSPGTGCEQVNGETVCAGSLPWAPYDPLPRGSCTTTPGGSAVCTVATPGGGQQQPTSPQAPDNGMPGQPAAATATISHTNSSGVTITNFYSSAVVGNSTYDPPASYSGGTTGTTTGTTGTTTGTTGTTTGTTGTTTGTTGDEGDNEPGTCEEGNLAACGGSGFAPGDLEEALTFQASVQGFQTRVSNSALVQGLDSVADAIPSGGSCPTSSFVALGQTFTLDSHCQFLSEYSGLLRAIFMCIYALAAIRLFFTA